MIKYSTISKITILYCFLYITMRALLTKVGGSIFNFLFILLVLSQVALYALEYNHMNTKIRKDRFFICLIFFFLFYIINLFACQNASAYSLYEYIFYLLFFFASLFSLEHVTFQWIVKKYLLFCSILSLEAIWEFVTGNIPFRTYETPQLIRRAFGLIGSPIILGMLLSISSLICLYLAIEKDKRYVLLFILNFGALLCTQSRGPLVSFVGGFIVAFIIQAKVKNPKKITMVLKRIFIIIVCAVVLYTIVVIMQKYNVFVHTIYLRLQTIFEWGTDNATNYERARRWNVTYELFLSHPILGYGVSSTGAHANTGIITESGVLKTLAETGIIGFIMYYGALVYAYVSYGRRCVIKKIELAPMAIGVITAVFIQNIIMQVIESAPIMYVLMLMIAYLAYGASPKSNSQRY